MFFTILIISVALGAEAEFQLFPVLLCAPANGAFMRNCTSLPLLHAAGIRTPPANLFGGITVHIAHSKEENQEISQG